MTDTAAAEAAGAAPASALGATITVMWSPALHAENGDPLYAAPLSTVLSGSSFDAYPDACTMPYVCDPPRRLGVADAGAPDVKIAACLVDVDSPAKARPELKGTVELEQWQMTQVDLAMTFDPPPLAIWESPSGGLRLYWLLEPGTVTPVDYNGRCAAFLDQLRAHGLDGIDPTSAQWTRFRAHAARRRAVPRASASAGGRGPHRAARRHRGGQPARAHARRRRLRHR
jgi:hypothetical protein